MRTTVLQLIGALGYLAVAVMVATDRKIVKMLRRAEATSSERAIPISVRSPLGPWRLRRLVSANAVVRTTSDRYYLVEDAYRELRSRRRRRALTIVAVLIPASMLAVWLLVRLT